MATRPVDNQNSASPSAVAVPRLPVRGVGLGGIFMGIEAALLLIAGFAGGYGVRELVSRRRRTAERRQYLERRAASQRQLLERRVSARSIIDRLASSVGATTQNQ